MLGRVESVRATFVLSVAPLGPLVGGILLASVSPRGTVAVFTLVSVVVAVWATVTPTLRRSTAAVG
jgi:hypothetical protein